MNRQWICIRGRRLLVTEFIHILDSYRCSSALRMRGDQVCKQYNAMICVLQELTSDYMEGKNYIFSTKFSGYRQTLQYYDRRLR